MEKKRVVPVWLSVVLVILCVFTIGTNVWLIVNGILNTEKFDAVSLLDMVFFAAASVLALIYCLKGYKKDSNKIFKICSIIFTIALLLQVAYKVLPNSTLGSDLPMPTSADMPAQVETEAGPTTNEYTNSILVITSAISFGCMMVLTIAENLGKKKSSILIAVVLFMSLIAACTIVDFKNLSTIVLNVNFGAFIYAVIYGIMIYAKYKDKEARSAK